MNLDGISKRLVEARLELTSGGTAYDLAELTGISQSSLWRWECGKSAPSLELIVWLNQVHRISANWLLFGLGPKRITEAGAPIADLTTTDIAAIALALPREQRIDLARKLLE